MLQLWKVINYSSRHFDSVGCKYSLAVQNSGKLSKSEQQKSPEAWTLSRKHEPACRRWEFLLCLVATGTQTASMSVNERKITEEGLHMNICIVVSGKKKKKEAWFTCYYRLWYNKDIIYQLLHVLMQTKKSLILQSVGTIFKEHFSLSVTWGWRLKLRVNKSTNPFAAINKPYVNKTCWY